jgi:hypothetical protein
MGSRFAQARRAKSDPSRRHEWQPPKEVAAWPVFQVLTAHFHHLCERYGREKATAALSVIQVNTGKVWRVISEPLFQFAPGVFDEMTCDRCIGRQ